MSKSFKKIASIGLSVSTAVYLFGATAIPAGAQTTADLQAMINSLLTQINALQAQLAAQSGGGAVASSYSFTRSLTVGSTGADVKALQQWLNANGYAVSASGAGSVGNESQYFGPATRAALAKYQAAVGISPAAGYFGPITRAKVAAVAPATPGTTPPVVVVPSGTGLVVSLASDSPSAKTIGSGTAFNPAAKFALTAGAQAVSVNSITFQKSGFVANTNINGVDVVDSQGMRHGQVVTSINADNTMTIVMTSDPINVPANSTEYITVRFNLLSGNYTGTVSFGINAVSAIAANTSAISGAFPLSGPAMNIVNGGNSLASTTIDVLTSTGSSTLNVDANSSQEITKFRIQETGSQEGVYLHSLSLYNYGNANAADYRDVTIEAQDGTILATAQPSGQYVTFNLASPYFIDKGLTKDFTVKAKLVGGTTKTIKLVVFNNYDIDLRGSTTGVSVIPGAGTNDSTFPLGNSYNQTTIGSGTITLTRAADSPSAAVVPGASSVVLAKFNAKPNGENYELRQVSFAVTTSSTGIDLTGTIYVKVNGSIVYSAGASNFSNVAATQTTVSLSAYPVLTAGVNNVITIEASAIPSSATSASTYTVDNFNIEQVKRLVSNDILSNGDTGLTTSDTDGLTISVQASALAVSTLATPAANSVVQGTVGYEYAAFQLNAQSGGEDVKVSTIVVTHTGTGPTEVANLLMYKDADTSPIATTASTATNAATVTFTFSQQVVVTRGTPVTLHLKADAVSGTNSHTFSIASSTSALTATGASTGNTLTNGSDITFTGTGQAMAHVTAGNLTVSLVSGSGATPSAARVMSVGSTGQTLLAFTLRSQFEAQKITSLKITASSTSGGALATSTLANLKLYEGNSSSPFAQASNFSSCVSGVCTYTWTASDNLLSAAVPTTGVTIYVKGDLNGGGSASLGDTFAMKIASTTADIAIKGAVTGSTAGTKSGSAGFSDTMYFTYVVPQTVAIESVQTGTQTLGSSGQGAQAGSSIATFRVTNNGSAAVRLATSSIWRFAHSGTSSSTYTAYIGDSSASANTSLQSTATSSVSNYVNLGALSASAANRTINGGATKYIVLKNENIILTGRTVTLSADAIGDLFFQVDESQLGYSGNAGTGDTDTDDVVQDLPISGMPQTGPTNTAL